jgi:hypothetical protein
MAFEIKYKDKNLNIEKAYLKIREVVIQDSGITIIKSCAYDSKSNRNIDINKSISLPSFYFDKNSKEGKEFIELVYKKAYELLKVKKLEDDKRKEKVLDLKNNKNSLEEELKIEANKDKENLDKNKIKELKEKIEILNKVIDEENDKVILKNLEIDILNNN